MKLSIIIPVYNEAPYIRRCLDSITLPEEVEVIVVDDFSTDGSREILEEYRDRFNIVRLDSNCGVSYARNVGMAGARGKYITFLDADDEYTPHAIETMLDAMDNSFEFPMIQFNHFRHMPKKQEDIFTRNLNPAGVYTLQDLPHFWQGVWNKIFLRHFLENNKIKFEFGLQYGEDECFVLECLRRYGKIRCRAEKTVIKHIQNPNSLSSQNNKKTLINMHHYLLRIGADDNSPEFDRMFRDLMVRHWASKHYKRYFGGLTDEDKV